MVRENQFFVMHWLPGGKRRNLGERYTLESIVIGNTGSAFNMDRGANFEYCRMLNKLITFSIPITVAYQIDFQVALSLRYRLIAAGMENHNAEELPIVYLR